MLESEEYFEKYLTGIQIIDEQHKSSFQILDKLNDTDKSLEDILIELKHYANTHFTKILKHLKII